MPWEQADAVAFRDYLIKNKGRVLAHMDETVPVLTVTEKSSVEGIALSGAFKEGYLKAIDTLKKLATIERRPEDASSGGFTAM
jgi:hypothetical protein